MSLEITYGLFKIEASEDNVEMKFRREKDRNYLNNLYPDFLHLLSLKFTSEVEKEINSAGGKLELNELTLKILRDALVRSLNIMPFTLASLLKRESL